MLRVCAGVGDRICRWLHVLAGGLALGPGRRFTLAGHPGEEQGHQAQVARGLEGEAGEAGVGTRVLAPFQAPANKAGACGWHAALLTCRLSSSASPSCGNWHSRRSPANLWPARQVPRTQHDHLVACIITSRLLPVSDPRALHLNFVHVLLRESCNSAHHAACTLVSLLTRSTPAGVLVGHVVPACPCGHGDHHSPAARGQILSRPRQELHARARPPPCSRRPRSTRALASSLGRLRSSPSLWAWQ